MRRLLNLADLLFHNASAVYKRAVWMLLFAFYTHTHTQVYVDCADAHIVAMLQFAIFYWIGRKATRVDYKIQNAGLIKELRFTS